MEIFSPAGRDSGTASYATDDDITPAKDPEKSERESLASKIDDDIELESDNMDLEGSIQISQSDHSDPLDTQQIQASMPSKSLTLKTSRQSVPTEKNASSSSSSKISAQRGNKTKLKQTRLIAVPVHSSRNELKLDKGTKKREFLHIEVYLAGPSEDR